jgi:hypothetical protein
VWATTAFACKNYCFFSVLDGAVLAPAAALPLGCCVALELELDEPPAAESFFCVSLDIEPDTAAEPLDGAAGAAVEELEELESFLLMSTLAEPEVEPAGAVVEPADDEEDAGGVVRETVRSPSRSQPVSNPAPSARETATAKVESLICGPPWVGVSLKEQQSGPSR